MSEKKSGGGLTVFTLLGVAFVILKLCKVINWSWLWVTAPFWIPLAIGLIAIAIYILVDSIKEKKHEKRNKRTCNMD